MAVEQADKPITLIFKCQMINYLAPILRAQFNLFYRYGYTLIPSSQVVEFDGKINDEAKAKIIELFKSLSPFEYDEEYLILHLDKEANESSSNIHFEIQNLISVYPLSKQAKVSIESKIDQRIKLEQPIFEIILPKIEANIHKTEITKAIDALWLICNLEGSKDELLQAIGIENIFQGVEFRKEGTKASKIKEGNYWSYLLAYDRFDYFPNSILGYFYDAGQVFAYSKNRPTFEGSELYKFLQKINSTNPDIKFKEAIALLEGEEQGKNYISQTTDNKIKQYFVAPIYLMLKDELRNAEDINQTKLVKHINYLLEFGDNFKAAVILLGAFFGYKKFYDSYYDKLELRFYKFRKQATPPKEIEKEEQKVEEAVLETKPELIGETTSIVSEPAVAVPINTDNNLSTPLNEYQNIILTTLKTKGDSKLSDIANEIKAQTGKKNITNQIIKNVIKEMHDIEIFKDKQTEKARIKTPALFDTTT